MPLDFDLTKDSQSAPKSLPVINDIDCHNDKELCIGGRCSMYVFDVDDDGKPTGEGGCLEVSAAMAMQEAADRLSEMLDSIGQLLANPAILQHLLGATRPNPPSDSGDLAGPRPAEESRA